MRKLLSKSAWSLLALLFVVVCGGCGGNWQTLDEEGFSVELPGQAEKQEQTAGPIKIYLYSLKQKNASFIVGYREDPPSAVTARDPELLFNSVRDYVIANTKGQITGERKATLGAFAGREITGISTEQNMSFTARVYLASPRVYMLVYSQYGKDPKVSADGQRFLDSFKIKEKP